MRSNPDDSVGFLADARRFNVATTRAKRKLVAVTDGDTVPAQPTYAAFADYARENGLKLDQ